MDAADSGGEHLRRSKHIGACDGRVRNVNRVRDAQLEGLAHGGHSVGPANGERVDLTFARGLDQLQGGLHGILVELVHGPVVGRARHGAIGEGAVGLEVGRELDGDQDAHGFQPSGAHSLAKRGTLLGQLRVESPPPPTKGSAMPTPTTSPATAALAELDRQVDAYVELGYPALAGLSESAFRDLFAPLAAPLADAVAAGLDLTFSPTRVPFVAVVTDALINPEARVPLLRAAGSDKPGILDRNYGEAG